jgi:hypothetical protein
MQSAQRLNMLEEVRVVTNVNRLRRPGRPARAAGTARLAFVFAFVWLVLQEKGLLLIRQARQPDSGDLA